LSILQPNPTLPSVAYVLYIPSRFPSPHLPHPQSITQIASTLVSSPTPVRPLALHFQHSHISNPTSPPQVKLSQKSANARFFPKSMPTRNGINSHYQYNMTISGTHVNAAPKAPTFSSELVHRNPTQALKPHLSVGVLWCERERGKKQTPPIRVNALKGPSLDGILGMLGFSESGRRGAGDGSQESQGFVDGAEILCWRSQGPAGSDGELREYIWRRE